MLGNIRDAPTLYLLIEILKGGRARSIQEVAHLEPLDVELLYTILRQRTGIALPSNFEDWYTWFVGSASNAPKSDQETLRMVKSMHDRDGKFTKPPR